MPPVETENLLLDVTVALSIALAGGWLATRLRLASIVGYVLAGIVISPFTPGFVGDVDRLRLLADIGVVLLLFAVGVQFSLSELSTAGPAVAVAAIAQTAIVIVVIAPVGLALGWSTGEAFYMGGAAAMSSSAVLVKLLDARAETGAPHGITTITWSVVQDFAGIVVIVVLGTVAGEDHGGSLGRESLFAAIKAAVFIGGVLFLGLRVVPIVLNQVAEERSRELFFLAIALLAIGTALASEYAGLSLALGAFLAGMVVSELDLSHRVLGELVPVRDVFAVLFFVSAGMLIDPSVISSQWLSVAALVSLIVVFRLFLTAGVFRFGLNTTIRTAFLGAAVLVPVGEYAFLLGAAGLDTGALSDDAFGVILSSAVISIVLSPVLMVLVDFALSRRQPSAAPPPSAPASMRVGRRAVIAGYDRSGQIVASLIAPRFDVLIYEPDHALARHARESGYEVVETSSVNSAMIGLLDLADARILVITLQDPFAARQLAEYALQVNPHLDIIASAIGTAEAAKLQRSGVGQTVVGDDEAALELARHSLHRFGVSSQESLAVIQRYRARMRTAT